MTHEDRQSTGSPRLADASTRLDDPSVRSEITTAFAAGGGLPVSIDHFVDPQVAARVAEALQAAHGWREEQFVESFLGDITRVDRPAFLNAPQRDRFASWERLELSRRAESGP